MFIITLLDFAVLITKDIGLIKLSKFQNKRKTLEWNIDKFHEIFYIAMIIEY